MDRASEADGPGSRRAAAGPLPVGRFLTRALDPAARRRGFELARLFDGWSDVVGDGIARLCTPIRLSGQPGRAVLQIRAAGAAALELQHTGPLVVERINAYFGRRVVDRLRLVQAPLPPARLVCEPPNARRLAPDETAGIDALVTAITDPELREALGALGRAVKGADSATPSPFSPHSRLRRRDPR